jgi:hypothetical protein
MEGYYVIFFDKNYVIKEAHKTKKYPTVKEIVYLLKSLEQLDLEEVQDLMMDILTDEEYRQISHRLK